MDNMEILKQWYDGIRVSNIRHRIAKSHYTRLHKLLGILVIVLTSVVGMTIFINLNEINKGTQIAIGFVSVIATILSSIQTFLNYSDLAERHNLVAMKYGSLRREIDGYLVSKGSEESLPQLFESIRSRWDQIDQEAPSLPIGIFKKGSEIVDARKLKLG